MSEAVKYAKGSPGWQREQIRLAAIGGKATTAVWPMPDLSIAERSQIKPPMLPTAGFGALQAWLRDAADAASAPIDYTALAALCGVSGMIGGRRWVQPWPGWKEPGIIWGSIVGDPSVNKTPSTDGVRAAVMAAEEHKARDYPQRESEYEGKLAASKAIRKVWEREVAKALKAGNELPTMPDGAIEPKRPIRPRCWVVNVTTEKLARIMSEDAGGVVAWTDELAGLIGGFDRYGGGGMDRAFWLEVLRRASVSPRSSEGRHNRCALHRGVDPGLDPARSAAQPGALGGQRRVCVPLPLRLARPARAQAA